MAQRYPSGTTGGEKSVTDLFSELWELVTTYVRQEALDPIKGVGRFVAFGAAGAVLIGVGSIFLAVGTLRLLQTETDTTFDGNLTWVPYAIVFTAFVAAGGIAVAAIGRGKGGKDRR